MLKKRKDRDDNVNLATEKLLDDSDLKKIRILKYKKTLEKIDKNRFKEDEEESESKS